MPPRTRSISRVEKLILPDPVSIAWSECGENDLKLCITNYFKCKKPMAGKVGSSRQGRAQFPMERELEFAEYLVEFKRANRMNKGNLKSEVFPAIVDKFAKKGCHFDPTQIKAKYYALRHLTQEYNRMRLRVTGAGWDPLLQTVIMDESKWQAVIKENPSFKTYHNKDCRVFYILSEVFDKMDAQGRYARDSNQPPVDINDEIRVRQSQAYDNMGGQGTEHVDLTDDIIPPMQSIGKSDAKHSKGKGKGKRKTLESSSAKDGDPPPGLSRSSYNNVISWMDATFASDRSTSQSVDAPPPPPAAAPAPPPPIYVDDDPYSVAKADEALTKIEGLSDKVAVTAAWKLADSADHRRMFLIQKSEARKRLYALKIGGGELDD
ncbi:uncharacterized protein LOC113748453 [Coffea eugenioides]|uniref:uncharacterized protein LOC113748453 n=1 Tax=Coffea eugenioides TaxID=49369 RepID=UPI000F60953C|nr:uncharacterized protein LOC113748453 [Coffea eugenioides]XP_027147816.1 uncharacterized protein LOC113748453 [Coffea eugenioides]XP_027147817.1 uncharacterized protein LOC113748453 [Coffea eugenioides]XP_027147818.1 uncharacterized protein LOC113748453 [Coffea eugenioides]XP_027147819.1 uncharacterized protein LOC113748453 [Coffea eugenioides]